jgi:RIO kinase 1
MSRMVSKRKRSSREDYPLSEQLKIEEGVFERRTMLHIKKLFTRNIISKLEFIIAKGKEADVYIADHGSSVPSDFVAVKIFRLETSSFEKRTDYINGDPRFFRIKSGISGIVNEWCKKEYSNLRIAEAAGLHSPKPYLFNGNILAMEFIGDSEGKPSQSLKAAGAADPVNALDSILEDMKKLYSRDLIHGDISEYNILMKDEVPYLIDFGQAVVKDHPKAEEFLKRDISVILSYFRKNYGISRNEDESFKQITS